MPDDQPVIGPRLAREEDAASIFRSEICNAAAAGICDAAAAGEIRGDSWSHMVGEVFDSGASGVVGSGGVYVHVDKTSGDPLGVEVRRQNCVVLGVAAGGLIDRWHRRNPSQSVSVGDRIINVNGVRGAM